MRARCRRPATRLLALALAALPLASGCEAVAPLVEPATLTIVARDHAFTPQRVRLPAGVPVQVTLRNADGDVPHGLRLVPLRSGVEAPVLLETEIITGPVERSFPVPALKPGPYLFVCPVHPTMLVEAEAG